MKKLGLLLVILSVVTFVLCYLGARMHPALMALQADPARYGWLTGIQIGLGVLGGWLFVYPFLLRKAGPALALVGLIAAIPAGFFAHGWAFDRAMPQAIAKLNSRWGGSYLTHASPEMLDQASTWVMELKGKRDAERAVRLHQVLGGYMQRMGRVAEAIKHLERAYALVTAEGSPFANQHSEVARALGIAHLRAGEIESCLTAPNEDSCIYPLHGTGIWTVKDEAIAAERYLREALEHAPGDPGLRWLLSLSQEVMGTYPTEIAEADLVPQLTRTGETDEVPHFRNLAVALGVEGDDLAGSVVIDDMDGDGFLDIVTLSYNPNDHVRYFRNDGKGGYEDWTAKAGLRDQIGGLNLTHADYNNDGRLDLLILRGAWFLDTGYQRNSLLRQEEDGSFTDVTVEAGMATEHPALAAAWADIDLDGDLDLYIGNERINTMGKGKGGGASAAKQGLAAKQDHAPSELFLNNGDGTFTDIAEQAGVQNWRFTRGTSFGDYDNDGYPDLVVSNLSTANRLYHNNGDNTFTDVAESPGMEFLQSPKRAFGSWWLDANNDGNLDLFVAGYPLTDKVNDVIADRYKEERGPRVDPCALYLGDGNGGFTDGTKDWNLDRVHLVMGANIGDVDSDGWMDIYLGTGAPSLEIMVPNTLLMNQGGQRFLDATPASGLGHLHQGHGIAFGDLDNDGDLDTYAQFGGWYCDSHSQNALFLNEGVSNHSLTLQLRGKTANHFGLGARVKAVVEENGQRREIQLVQVGTGSFGSNPMEQFIGLGGASQVLELEIQWPNAEKTRQTLRNLPVDKTLRITEGEEGWEVVEEQVLPLMRQ